MGSKRKWEVPSRHTVWEFDEDAPVGAEAEAILSERGAEEIAAELIEAGAIVGGDPDVGVQVEAVEVACAVAAMFPPARVAVIEIRLVQELKHSRDRRGLPS